MQENIRNIPINPTLSAERCREMVSRVQTVRQGAIAETWLFANRIITRTQLIELEKELNQRIREAYQREIEKYS